MYLRGTRRTSMINETLSLRQRMERSATYLASAEQGAGLDPEIVEYSLFCIRNWKKYFVQYMIGKQNMRDGGLLTKHTASELADNIFRAFYDMEVRAFAEPTKGLYNEREPGALEFGDLSELFTDHEDALNRDENRNHWKKVQVARAHTPWENKRRNYGLLLQMLRKNPGKHNKVLRNATVLRLNGSISWKHWEALAGHVNELRASV